MKCQYDTGVPHLERSSSSKAGMLLWTCWDLEPNLLLPNVLRWTVYNNRELPFWKCNKLGSNVLCCFNSLAVHWICFSLYNGMDLELHKLIDTLFFSLKDMHFHICSQKVTAIQGRRVLTVIKGIRCPSVSSRSLAWIATLCRLFVFSSKAKPWAVGSGAHSDTCVLLGRRMTDPHTYTQENLSLPLGSLHLTLDLYFEHRQPCSSSWHTPHFSAIKGITFVFVSPDGLCVSESICLYTCLHQCMP